MSKKNICQQELNVNHKVHNVISALNIGGAEKLLVSLLPLLREDFDVKLVCIREQGALAQELEHAGVPVTMVPFRSRLHPLSLRQYTRILKRENINIVHTHMYRPHVSGILSAWLAGIPVRISTVHTTNQWDTSKQLYMDSIISRICTCIIAVSNVVKQNYLDKTRVPESKCRVIYNGVNTDKFKPRNPAPTIYKSLGLDPRVPIFGAIGRLIEDKGHIVFLESALKILEQYPHSRFLIIGDGPQKNILQEFVTKNNMTGKILFTGMRNDVEELIQVCKAIMFPSKREGLSIALLESMSCGKPIIATNVGGNPEVVIPGETGFLVPVDDKDAMVKAALELISNPELAHKMGESARERVIQRFSIKTMYEQTRDLYLELLENQGLL